MPLLVLSYYTGVPDSSPSEMQLYRRPDSDAPRPAAAACLSCHSAALAGRRCHSLRVFFPPPAGDVSTPAGDVRTPTGDVSTPVGDVRTPAGDVSTPAGDVMAVECAEGATRRLLVVDRALERPPAVLDASAELVERTRPLAAPHVLTETVRLGEETAQLEVMLPKLWDEKKGGTYLFPFVLDL